MAEIFEDAQNSFLDYADQRRISNLVERLKPVELMELSVLCLAWGFRRLANGEILFANLYFELAGKFGAIAVKTDQAILAAETIE